MLTMVVVGIFMAYAMMDNVLDMMENTMAG